jgi:hypothetical protein
LWLIVLVPPAGCLQAGCVRNSDCVSAEWCIDTKCVPRPVDGGTNASDAGDSGVPADAAMSSQTAADKSAFVDAGSRRADAGHDSGAVKDAGIGTDAAQQM